MHRIDHRFLGGLRACLTLLLTLTLAAVPAFAADDEMSAHLTDEERAHIVELLEASQSEMEALAAEAEGDLWSAEPAPDSWSVGEVVEHLVLAEEMFYGILTQTLESEPNPDWQSVAEPGTAEPRDDRAGPLAEVPGARAAPADRRAVAGGSPRPLRHRPGPDPGAVRSLDGAVKQHTFTGPPGTMNVQQWLVLGGRPQPAPQPADEGSARSRALRVALPRLAHCRAASTSASAASDSSAGYRVRISSNARRCSSRSVAETTRVRE